jgi:hypothetical protein
VQLIGDGAAETATRLNWAGPEGGVVLRLEGPSRATLRDFYIHAPNARAIVVEDADQPGGRIFADQLNVSGPIGQAANRSGAYEASGAGMRPARRTAALRVNGLAETDVLLRCLQGSGNSGAWVEAVGQDSSLSQSSKEPAVDNPLPRRNQVCVFNGATGSAVGQYDVRNGGQLVVRGVYHERSADSLRGIYLGDTGTLAIDATRFSYATSPTAPTVAAHDFKGLFTLATSILMPVETTNTCRFELSGNGSAASVLALNNQFWVLEPGVTSEKVWLNRADPPARGGLVGCNMNSPNKHALKTGFAFLENVGDHPDIARSKHGAGPLDDRGGTDDATLLRHLAPLRQARVWAPTETSKEATDLRIHRVMASGGMEATVEFVALKFQTAEKTALYRGLQTNQFMKCWLVLAPLPVFPGAAKADDEAAQKKAFATDFLAEHGGEAGIQPEPEALLRIGGNDLAWRLVESKNDTVSLLSPGAWRAGHTTDQVPDRLDHKTVHRRRHTPAAETRQAQRR